MLHLIFWLTKSLLLLSLKFLFFFFMIFLTCSFLHLFNLTKTSRIFFVTPVITTIIFLLSPFWVSGGVSFFMVITLVFYTFTPDEPMKISLMKLFTKSLKILIEFREMMYIPNNHYFFLHSLKSLLLIFSLLLLAVMFASSHQIFILALILTCSTTALLSGLACSFFSSLLSLSFSNRLQTPPVDFSPSDSSAPLQFASFLEAKMNSHPLNAMIDESFYEDNLQMGDFFLAYPLFFKASQTNSPFMSKEDEVTALWHVIRWESAFSKQTGSATSRWSSLYGVNFSSMPSSAHSVHTPLIPVFDPEIFHALESSNLPTFNPFNQPPEWSPYKIVMSFLNWSEEEMKEERLVEMEEED